MDTSKIYKQLLSALQNAGYKFITFEAYCEGKRPEKFVIMRHDVDLRAGHSWLQRRRRSGFGNESFLFFRVVPQSNQPDKIRAMAALGHEIGYHYEDLSLFKGDMEAAEAHFEKQLAHFRQFLSCPHRLYARSGPASRYDNRDLWKHYNYRDFGVIGEPYFDVDFECVLSDRYRPLLGWG